MPDWNQVQVSMSSACGQDFAISRTMVAVACSATSCSGAPTLVASTQARAADVGNAGHLGDVGDLLGRLDHAQLHGRGRDVDELHLRKLGLQQAQEVDVDRVELDAKALHAAGQLADGVEVVVFCPIGVGDVRREGAPPRLARIDAGADAGGGVLIDDQAVTSAEVAEQEVGVVANIMV